MMSPPTLDREAKRWQRGDTVVAGIDEAGRGALAGPVVAAAVVVPAGTRQTGLWTQVRDSKQLTPRVRAELARAIKQTAMGWGVGVVSATVIDEIGIAPATRQAMLNAVNALAVKPDYLLIDWVKLPALNIRQESFAKADQLSVSVAAASILAKEHRDRLMIELGRSYPQYGFATHKGYGTQAHREAIQRHDPCPEHRHSFAPIAARPTLFERPTGGDPVAGDGATTP
jgi:ribonuclease HII